MTINNLARLIAKKEGKKSQARMGDVKEILSILSDVAFDYETNFFRDEPEFLSEPYGNDIFESLIQNGHNRSKKIKKK